MHVPIKPTTKFTKLLRSSTTTQYSHSTKLSGYLIERCFPVSLFLGMFRQSLFKLSTIPTWSLPCMLNWLVYTVWVLCAATHRKNCRLKKKTAVQPKIHTFFFFFASSGMCADRSAAARALDYWGNRTGLAPLFSLRMLVLRASILLPQQRIRCRFLYVLWVLVF